MTRWSSILAMVIAVAFYPAIVSSQNFRDGAVAQLDIRFPPQGIDLTGDGLVWTHIVHSPVMNGTDAPPLVRLRFSNVTLPETGTFWIEISDAAGQLVETVDAHLLQSRSPLWTLAVPGTSVAVSVHGAGATEGLSFKIDRIAFPLDSVALESIFGENELTDIVDYDGELLDVVSAVQSSVAILHMLDQGATDKCTAFRVAPDIILTSGHCVSDARTCRDTTVMFGYQKNTFGGIEIGQQVRCESVLAAASVEQEDIAILRVAPIPSDDWGTVSFRGAGPEEGEQLFIVQHPGGEPKKLSIIDCGLLETDEAIGDLNAFGHSCDTKGGSSGAPIFGKDGLVVGQQRAGHKIPGLTTLPSKGTRGAVLALWVNAQLAITILQPISVDVDEEQADKPTIPTDAVPLPLPTAPESVIIDDNSFSEPGPSVQSSGSSGSTEIAPEP